MSVRRLCAALALALAACGGGGGDDDEDAALLPFLAEDELVGRFAPGASVGTFEVCTSGAAVYVAWTELNGPGTTPVMFSRSLDHGRTWLPEPVRLDDPLSGSSVDLALCCDGPDVYAVYEKVQGTERTVRLNRSRDGGSTFLFREVPVSDAGARDIDDLGAFCAGSDVHVAWIEGRSPAGTLVHDVRYARSRDGGLTFPVTNVQLNSDPADTSASDRLSVCGDATHVYAVWVQDRSGTKSVRANRSLDGGDTFLATDVAVSHVAGTLGDVPQAPSVDCDGDVLVAAWADARNGTSFDVFVNRSVDGGATFLDRDRGARAASFGAGSGTDPAVCLDGDVVHVVWIDDRAGKDEVRTHRAGLDLAFDREDLGLDRAGASGALFVADPRVECRDGRVVAAWADGRVGDFRSLDAFVAVSEDGGATFEEVRVNTDAPADGASIEPRISIDGDELTVVWIDDRDGGFQVRSNRTAR